MNRGCAWPGVNDGGACSSSEGGAVCAGVLSGGACSANRMTRAGELSLVRARLEEPPISSFFNRSNRLRRPNPEPRGLRVGRGRPIGSPGGRRMESEAPRVWARRCPKESLRKGVGGGIATVSGPAASPLSEGDGDCTAIACLASALRRKDSLLRPLVVWCFFLGGVMWESGSISEAPETGSSSHSSFSSSATILVAWEPLASGGVAILVFPFLLELLALLEMLEGRLVSPVAAFTNFRVDSTNVLVGGMECRYLRTSSRIDCGATVNRWTVFLSFGRDPSSKAL